MGNDYMKDVNTFNLEKLKKDLDEAIAGLDEVGSKQDAAAAQLLEHQISNVKALYDAEIKYLNKSKEFRLKNEQEINEKLISLGYDAQQVLAAKSRKDKEQEIKDEYAAKLQAEKDPAKKKLLRQQRKEALNEAKKNETELDKLKTKLRKQQNKEYGKELQNAVKTAWSNSGLSELGGALFGRGAAKNAVRENLVRRENESEESYNKRVNKATSALQMAALSNALNGFAKQLESTINDIADSQTAIDTRLQGARGSKYMGSYWKQMSLDVTRYVGMSPFIKQADVVNNLKTMIGKGISFNVEQRAFLDTISDKIATTFEATDSTLLKLVRIQQQDTTAARLGMESALTAFLNNMYETTEYMTDAAKSVRTQLAEAEALMGASSATEFEYQVQKWMGSLYSVGFGNAEGLSGALGKLAAGDISGITDGGYGNLLIMAANEAGISITDALEQGLDATKTNNLMEAMVDYLAKIYNDSQGSKVIAQQFANVYGLSASDLKAAAQLAGSNRAIAGNGLGYSGMLQQLNNMADTMYKRVSVGGMMTNMFDNLKYATAASMANNPALYATYTIASMLDDTVGGIAIPSIMAMGTGFDLETTVADLMRVGSLSGGLLAGVGKMLSGLGTGGGFSGSGMLRAFGVGSSPTVVTRGSGSGLLTTNMSTLSESGSFMANSDGSDVQNKTMTDAEDSANNKVSAAEDNKQDVTIKTVDEHVVKIHELLEAVTNGSKTFKVDMGDVASWTDALRRY